MRDNEILPGLSARADLTEHTHDELRKTNLELTAALAERDALREVNSRLLTGLQSAQRELERKAAAVAELAARAQLAEARRDDLARQNKALNRRLADSTAEQINSRRELQDLQQGAGARQASHAKALADVRRDRDSAVQSLRAQLVDAEAALAIATAGAARRGLRSWLTPAVVKSRRLARQLLRSGLFDADFYREQYPAARDALDAARHYVEQGCSSGFRPNPMFDTRWYLDRYEDVRRSGQNPLLHYLQHGVEEGRDPGPSFETSYYLESNPDVRDHGSNPLVHYLRFGRSEGRLAVRPG